MVFCHMADAQTNPANQDRIELTAMKGIKIFTAEQNFLSGNYYGFEAAYHFNMAQNQAKFVKAINLRDIDVVAIYRKTDQILLNNNLASKGLIGNTYGLMGRLEIQVAKAGPVRLLFTPGLGFVYATETYFTNQNPLISSHVNLAAQAAVKVQAAITPTTALQAGVGIFHYSNGGMRLPNNGVNAYDATLGIVQNLPYERASHTPDPRFENVHKHSADVGVDFGARGVFRQNRSYARTGLYAHYSYRLNQAISLTAGPDAVYYNTVFKDDQFDELFQNYGTSYDHWRVGLSAGTDIWVGKLAIMLSAGRYLHFNTVATAFGKEYNTKYYWTGGVKYYVLPWLGIQGKGYVHGTEADYIGLGLTAKIHQ